MSALDNAKQISQVDEKLSILRESWMEAKPENKARWMSRIDTALDERILLTNGGVI